MSFTRDQQQNYVYSKHAIQVSLKLSFRNSFLTVGGAFWLNQIKGDGLKYSESCVSSGLYVSLFLKNVTYLHSFCKWKHIGKGGGFTVCLGSDKYVLFSFAPLQLFLIEGGLFLPPEIKVVTSTARCESL